MNFDPSFFGDASDFADHGDMLALSIRHEESGHFLTEFVALRVTRYHGFERNESSIVAHVVFALSEAGLIPRPMLIVNFEGRIFITVPTSASPEDLNAIATIASAKAGKLKFKLLRHRAKQTPPPQEESKGMNMQDNIIDMRGLPPEVYAILSEKISAERPDLADWVAVDLGTVPDEENFDILRLTVASMNGDGLPACMVGTFFIGKKDSDAGNVYIVFEPRDVFVEADTATLRAAIRVRVLERLKTLGIKFAANEFRRRAESN